MTTISKYMLTARHAGYSSRYRSYIRVTMITIRMLFWEWINSFGSPTDRGSVRITTKQPTCKACKDYG